MTTEFLPIHDAADLRSISHDWNDLIELLGGTVFDTPEWTLASIESFPPVRAGVLVERSAGSIVGIVPMAVRRGRRDLIARTWIELASLPHSDYGGLLASRSESPAVAEAILDRFTREQGVSAARLGHLPDTHPFAQGFPEVARMRRAHLHMQPGYTVRTVMLDEPASLPLMNRPSLNKRERQLSREGTLRFRVVTEWRELLDQLSPFFELHARRFEAKGMRSPLQDARMRSFYGAIVKRLGPVGGVVLSTLSLDASPVAMRLSLRSGNTLYLYAATFDPIYGRYSPGLLQLRRLIAYAADEGFTCLDLGIGEAEHKQLFEGATTTQLVNLAVYRNVLGSAEASGADRIRRIAANHRSVTEAGSRLRRLLPARQPE